MVQNHKSNYRQNLAPHPRKHAISHTDYPCRRNRLPSRTPARPTNGLATATHAGCFAFIIASRFPTSPLRVSAGVVSAIKAGAADSTPMTNTNPASTFGGVAALAIRAHEYPPNMAAPIPSAKLATIHNTDGS